MAQPAEHLPLPAGLRFVDRAVDLLTQLPTGKRTVTDKELELRIQFVELLAESERDDGGDPEKNVLVLDLRQRNLLDAFSRAQNESRGILFLYQRRLSSEQLRRLRSAETGM